MSRHAAPRRRWFGRGRTRALLSLGLVLGLGVVHTMAYWTDQATMTTGEIAAGTLDLRLLNGATLVGQGGTWNNTAFAASNLTPGESVAFSFPVRNDGTTPFRFTATASASGNLRPGLRFTTTHGSNTASNSGSAANANRVGTCGANTVATSSVTLGTTATTVIASPGVQRAAGELITVCIIVRLDPSAGNELQGQTAQATFVFDATQLAP